MTLDMGGMEIFLIGTGKLISNWIKYRTWHESKIKQAQLSYNIDNNVPWRNLELFPMTTMVFHDHQLCKLVYVPVSRDLVNFIFSKEDAKR